MANFKITPLLVILLVSFCGNKPPEGSLSECRIVVTSETGEKKELTVEVADTESARNKGLMFRENLDYNRGMLFVFEKSRHLAFWMKNTYIPLDIAYINDKGVINEIYTMKPLDYSVTYNSIKPAKYALEVNAGWFSSNKISAGAKIEFYGCFSQ